MNRMLTVHNQNKLNAHRYDEIDETAIKFISQLI